MSTLKIEIKLDNAAFADSQEANRILADFTRFHTIGKMTEGVSLRDINGNKVGFAKVVD